MGRARVITLMLVVAIAALVLAFVAEQRRAKARLARLHIEMEHERVAMWRAMTEALPLQNWGPPGSSPHRQVYESVGEDSSRGARPAKGEVAEGHHRIVERRRAHGARCRHLAKQARAEAAAAAARAQHYDELAVKYERAASEPWLPVAPDPPAPR